MDSFESSLLPVVEAISESGLATENPGEELGIDELSEVDSQRRNYKWLR